MFNAIIASYSSAGEEAMGAMFSALSSLFSSFISLAFAAAAFVGLWFVFKKMGFPGWKGIIPFYNDYVLFDTLWEKKKFVRYVVYYGITLVATVIGVIFCVFGTGLIIGGAAMYNASYSYQGAGVSMIIGGSVLTLIGFLFSVAGLVFAILLLVTTGKDWFDFHACGAVGTCLSDAGHFQLYTKFAMSVMLTALAFVTAASGFSTRDGKILRIAFIFSLLADFSFSMIKAIAPDAGSLSTALGIACFMAFQTVLIYRHSRTSESDKSIPKIYWLLAVALVAAVVLGANFDATDPIGNAAKGGRAAAIVLEEEPEDRL